AGGRPVPPHRGARGRAGRRRAPRARAARARPRPHERAVARAAGAADRDGVLGRARARGPARARPHARAADGGRERRARRQHGHVADQAHPAEIRGRRSGLRRDRDRLRHGLPLERRARAVSRLGLKSQLLAVSVLTLALPWAGVRYVIEMEAALRSGLEQSLTASAVTIASALASGDLAFGGAASDFDSTVYAHPLRAAPRIDGNGDDWSIPAGAAREIAPGKRYVAGTDERYAYLLLEIRDDRIVYQRVPGEAPHGDRIALALGAHGDTLLLLQTGAPGTLRAQRTTRGDFLTTGDYEDRVIA